MVWLFFLFSVISISFPLLSGLWFFCYFGRVGFLLLTCVFGVELACVGVAQGGWRDLDGPRTDAGVDTCHVGRWTCGAAYRTRSAYACACGALGVEHLLIGSVGFVLGRRWAG